MVTESLSTHQLHNYWSLGATFPGNFKVWHKGDLYVHDHHLYLFLISPEKPHHEEGVKRKRGPAKSVCPYNKASALQQMRDDVLGAIHDIEQLLKLGKETHSCPYYATRLAIPPAQVNHCSLFICPW